MHLSVSTDEYNQQDLNKTLVVTLRQRPTDESFVKEPDVGCQSFTLRSLRSFEKNFWSCRHEGRERRLC